MALCSSCMPCKEGFKTYGTGTMRGVCTPESESSISQCIVSMTND